MIVGLQAVQSREDRPWIITAGHRPMYCSTLAGGDCDHRENIVRIFIRPKHSIGTMVTIQ